MRLPSSFLRRCCRRCLCLVSNHQPQFAPPLRRNYLRRRRHCHCHCVLVSVSVRADDSVRGLWRGGDAGGPAGMLPRFRSFLPSFPRLRNAASFLFVLRGIAGLGPHSSLHRGGTVGRLARSLARSLPRSPNRQHESFHGLPLLSLSLSLPLPLPTYLPYSESEREVCRRFERPSRDKSRNLPPQVMGNSA